MKTVLNLDIDNFSKENEPDKNWIFTAKLRFTDDLSPKDFEAEKSPAILLVKYTCKPTIVQEEINVMDRNVINDGKFSRLDRNGFEIVQSSLHTSKILA